jgi:hypothetical protein
MQAEPGNQLETYWLMFAAAGPGMSAAAIKDAKMPATFADDSRMLRLIEMAASESDSTMDLTVIAIAALRDRRKRSQLQGKNIELMEAELEAAILDLSKEGSASKTAPGEFSVLHSLEQSTQQIESNLREVAGKFGVNREELGFTSTTVKIEPGSSPSAIREKIAFAYSSVRDDIEEFDRSATPVDMMKVLAFCAIALAIGGIVGAMLAYMP